MLRHSFASHVLQSSGDLRAVQELLGHANITTTQVYTKLDFGHLSKVYDAAHPRAKNADEHCGSRKLSLLPQRRKDAEDAEMSEDLRDRGANSVPRGARICGGTTPSLCASGSVACSRQIERRSSTAATSAARRS